ncbi:MAG: PAS domain-containing protein [Desulfobacteraceae bacterium]|nr:PAS domain-containing protein [Desulfobacteraceae bacterium]
MTLRIILFVLSLLSFVSVWTGGYLYYASLKASAFKDADKQVALHAESIKNNLSSFLGENLNSARALAGLKELHQALSKKDADSLAKANSILDHFDDALEVDVCYLMNSEGLTIASSNRNASDSFVGENYVFRPYFKQAIRGTPSIYMALGVTSRKRGAYYSHPVYGEKGNTPIGVAVIKAVIDPMEKNFSQTYEGTVLLTDPDGVIFMSNRKDWLYHLLWRLPPRKISQITQSKQFGEGPWNWTGLERKDRAHVIDRSGNEYLIRQIKMDNYRGWSIVFLRSLSSVYKKVYDPLMRTTVPLILTLCILIGLSVFYLYRKASHDILRRKVAEVALKESGETARALLNAPTESALLLDTVGTILALNRPAADSLGKSMEELVGLSAFYQFSPDIAESRKAHHEEVLGSGKPVRYEDERKGRWRDTNVYPVFDAQGKVVRVAIFSRDITDQKRAEEELKLAKEELTRYSKNLEAQVEERTKEVTSILENTPAVVFVKDSELRYLFVNSRYEELFQIKNNEIKGKTDYEIFPKETSDQLRENDMKVVTEGRPFQVEERIPQEDGLHTYLSVKFPLYDEHGAIQSFCGIATDITELKKAQDQLRRLSASIMTSQEKERTAIARELHDELGQMLTALRMDAVWVRNHLKENDPKAAERALTMCNLIDKSIDEVQGMAIRLRPGVLDDLGLIEALEWYTTEFEKRSEIACIFNHRNVPRIRDILATASYRIAQEALTNVARHSYATNVDVVLEAERDILTLSVEDNGSGFNTQRLSGSECLGIAGMRERAGLVGGTLDIESEPGEGTHLYFRVPLHSQRGANL